jgi:predicted AAA+ superfamily ATPase
MDFPEYLSALGQDALWDEILQHSAQRTQLSAPLHERCLDLYRCYLWVGGMPEAVANLIAHDIDPLHTERGILDVILESYVADMSKHILTPLEAARIQAVYHSLPSQLGNASRKFQYAEVRAGARARDYASALGWLVASEIVRCVTMVSTPTSPLRAYERDGFFKLFLNDTGLLCQLVGVRATAVLLDHDMPFRGAIAENYVACQLAARGVPLFYWRDDNNAEIDFVIDTDEGVIPLEVKAGVRVKSASLEMYRIRFDPPYVIRFSTRNFGSKDGVVSLPLYAAASLCSGSEV